MGDIRGGNGFENVQHSYDYFMGVFEVTKAQYSRVVGGDLSNIMTPVDNVSYVALRGAESLDGWPAAEVSSNSFMEKIRLRTNLNFDLPTEAQWEYACRAGTTSDYNNGGSSEGDLKLLGRYNGNGGTYAKVGSYMPNAWGLYDMHGNAWEWCLDVFGGLSANIKDRLVKTGNFSYRKVIRGGGCDSWGGSSEQCKSWYRCDDHHNNESYTRDTIGFRLSLTICE